MNKKWVTIAVLGVVLIGGGFWAYKHFKAKPAAASLLTAQVKTGDVQKVITATGTVNYPNPISLSFDLNSNQATKLVALNVNPGDKVKKGQVLAQLDTSDLQTSVQSAQASLTLAQANYQKTLDSEESTLLNAISTAQQQLNNAQQTLATDQQNADPGYLANQVNLAQQNLLAASNDLASAQAKAAQTGNSSGVQSAQTALTQAQQALANAQYQQNGGAAQTLKQAQSAVEVAQANLAQAQNQWQNYQQGQPSTDVLSAQSNLSSAQNQLTTAQKNLDNAQLVAPDDGTVITVPVKNYQSVNSSTTILTLAVGSENMEVDASVDQADISQVKVGQKVDVTLDSQPNQHMPGTITQVALQGTTTQNVTTYTVTIIMDGATPLLKAGMNANVSIILAEAKGVLTVPSEAIRGSGAHTMVLMPGPAPGGNNAGNGNSEGTAGTSGNKGSYSNRQNGTTNGAANGNPADGTNGARASGQGGAGFSLNGINAHLVPVEIGLDDGTNVEIKSGLTEGQEVVIGIKSATSGTSSGPSSGGNRNGGNNPGRALHIMGG